MQERILVVDDDVDIRNLLTTTFSRANYDVTCVNSAEDVLAIQHDEVFSLYFIDLQLPGMNGLELCREIREDDATSILIAITAHVSIFQIVDAREAGFDDLYYKPFKSDELVEAAKDAFKRMERWTKMT